MPKQRRTSTSRPVAKKTPAVRVQPTRKAAPKPPHAASTASRHRAPTPPPAKVATKAAAQPVSKFAAKPVAKAAAKPVARHAAAKARPPAAPPAAASHEQAVEAFERGFRALQQRQFDRAASALKAVLSGFPDEKEMQERARVYLSICERQAGGAAHRPRSFEERVNAATVFINRGAFDDGLRLLRELESESPHSDHVQYLLTVAFTSMGEVDKALSHFRRAVELNPEIKFQSTSDADLEPLRQHSAFLATFGPSSGLPASRRRPTARRR